MLANVTVCLEQARMADTELVSAIALGLSYFYMKCQQNKKKRRNIPSRIQRREWMMKIHRHRTRQFMESKFYEILHEPSLECHDFCRMNYADFYFLLEKISPMISKKDTDFREAIPAKYRLLITLRFLASGESFSSLHYLFKVSVQSISKIIRDVCRALNEVLKDEIKVPTTAEEWLNIEEGFRDKFPHCVGVLAGKRILIKGACHSGIEAEKSCIVLNALMDSQYKFIYADIGCQIISDSRVFNNPLLLQKICRKEIDFPPPSTLPGSDINVPYVFLADDAFELSTHVMKTYPGDHDHGSSKRIFNESLSRSRAVVENTFGILTSVFGVLQRPINLYVQFVPEITMTCVLLHNFIIKSKNSSHIYAPPGTFDIYDGSGNLTTPGKWRERPCKYSAIQNLPSIPRTSSIDAEQIRHEFSSFFYRRD